MEFLDSDRNEGRSLKEIATEIVDEYHAILLGAVKKPATPLRLGMLIKSPYDSKVRRVAWLDDQAGKVWIVHETSSYGWLGPLFPPTWEYCEEYRPKKRVEVDGKGKMLEMTDDEIDVAWSNPDWSVGDKVSQSQRAHTFEVIAVAPACVLMRDTVSGILNVDSNKNLIHFYRREEGEVEW
jgi:hypothetical protein